MMNEQEVQSTLIRLPPGPWHAVGNTIRAGSQNIAHVTFSRPGVPASFIARVLAKMPELLADTTAQEEIDTLLAKVEELEDRIADLELDRDELQATVNEYREEEKAKDGK
jgi:hypothetical protein